MSNKFKPNKGLLKRIRVTATGRFKLRHAGSGHLLSHKSGKRRRHLRAPVMAAPADEKRLRRLLGM